MTIEDDIRTWAITRPGWQQRVLVSLSKDIDISDAKIVELVTELVETDATPPTLDAKEIALKSNATDQVGLSKVSHKEGVNALAKDQSIEFSKTGVTVVFGNNGSGKSGYARLVKGMVSARHSSEVLPDVFAETPLTPKASIEYAVADVPAQVEFNQPVPAPLRKVAFYDEHCGDHYISYKSTISYRPSALKLLDGLIGVCDRTGQAIREQIQQSDSTALKLKINPSTTAGIFYAALNSETTLQQVEIATSVPEDIGTQLGASLAEEARLASSNPAAEKAKLARAADQADQLSAHVQTMLQAVSKEALTSIQLQTDVAKSTRDAARLAAATSFEEEPLTGIGADSWRSLWESAREFSQRHPYVDHEFPYLGESARCVLCQQPHTAESAARMTKFDEYMRDTTEQKAQAAEGALASSMLKLSKLEPITSHVSGLLATLADFDVQLIAATQSLLSKVVDQRDSLVIFATDGGVQPAEFPEASPVEALAALGLQLRTRSDEMDLTDFENKRSENLKIRDDLTALTLLADSKADLLVEIDRLGRVAKLRRAESQTATNSITATSSSLTRTHATAAILDRFTRESDRLKLTKVTLQDMGGSKGVLSQKPSLLGAKILTAATSTVLSEGEQTALGLAGFFTEAEFDNSFSALVLDDPVTSLDHVRRSYVAERLVQLAKDRQVIVFTHEVAFVTDLDIAAQAEGVVVHGVSVERRGEESPGFTVQALPWKVKDFKARVAELEVDLNRLEKDRPSLMDTEYEDKTSHWAGRLSQAWERAVSSEVLNQVFDRGTSQVRPAKFRLFALITQADDDDFQAGYGKCSGWAARHDQAPEINYVAPEIEKLRAELTRLKEWQKRISKYL